MIQKIPTLKTLYTHFNVPLFSSSFGIVGAFFDDLQSIILPQNTNDLPISTEMFLQESE